MGSEENGCELPLLMHRDCGNLRNSGAVHEPEVGSVSCNLLSDVLGSDSPAHESSSEFRMFPSLSEMISIIIIQMTVCKIVGNQSNFGMTKKLSNARNLTTFTI